MARRSNETRRPRVNTALGDRKRAERELRRSEAYLAEGQRLTRTGSWALNVSSRASFWSLELFRILNFDPVSTKPSFSAFLERIHPADRLAVEQKIDRAAREGNDFEHEYRLLLPNGSIRHIYGAGHPVVDRAGEIVQLIGAAV